MPRVTDARNNVGGHVNALAKFVTSSSECHRLFGSNCDKRTVNSTVVEVIKEQLPGNKRMSKFVVADFFINNCRPSKRAKINIRSVKAGHDATVPVPPPTPTHLQMDSVVATP